YIDSCKKIEYMFPKGHATAYVIMTVRIGYFKLYKPSAFYAAVFSVKTEDFDYTTMCTGYLNAKKACVPHDENLSATEKSRMSLLEIVMEMYARGIDFAPLDLYKSDAYRFLPVEGSERLILPPLSAVPGLGLSAAKKIVDERAIQPFFTIEQFKDRTKVNKTVLALLRSHNMLDGLPEDDQITLL
ncbi:MAG: hypothetical protein FWE82_06780, partial [Defluviitaleaceae bacterium]|nr:hypothetical protein [Defluviitaleaceae bacterium]